VRRSLLVVALSLVCVIPPICAQEVRPPSAAVAGSEVSIATTGSEKATFYLIGPGTSVKRDVQMGQEVKLQPQENRLCELSLSSGEFSEACAGDDWSP